MGEQPRPRLYAPAPSRPFTNPRPKQDKQDRPRGVTQVDFYINSPSEEK